jgi:DNA-binding winged helix-turn-helix (wHTH) protein
MEKANEGAPMNEWYSTETGLSLSASCRLLHRGDEVLAISPKCLDFLLTLAHHSDRVVSRSELVEAMWPGTTVCKSALDQIVRQTPRALDAHASRVLRTVRGTGYQLLTFSIVCKASAASPEFSRNVAQPTPLELCHSAADALERVASMLRAIGESLDAVYAAAPGGRAAYTA